MVIWEALCGVWDRLAGRALDRGGYVVAQLLSPPQRRLDAADLEFPRRNLARRFPTAPGCIQLAFMAGQHPAKRVLAAAGEGAILAGPGGPVR